MTLTEVFRAARMLADSGYEIIKIWERTKTREKESYYFKRFFNYTGKYGLVCFDPEGQRCTFYTINGKLKPILDSLAVVCYNE